MAPSIKLYFFPGRARAEVLRLLLAAARVDYDMVTFSVEEWNTSYKKVMPHGGCPVLEIDGKMYTQSVALASYLAEEYDMNGENSKDRLIINQLLCLKEEHMGHEGKVFNEQDPKLKDEYTKEFYEHQYPRYLGYFAKFLEGSNSEKRFVLGDKLSAGDLAIFAATTTLEQVRPDLLAQYPTVVRLRKNVSQVDGIREYLASRPVTVI